MGETTAIEWADATANFWEGCTQVSPGCDRCYAMELAKRFNSVEWNGPPRKVAAGVEVVRKLQRKAVRTGERPFIFVNSISDFFDNRAPHEWRVEALQTMWEAQGCTFLLLTKRIGNVETMLQRAGVEMGRHFPHVWLGISVVNQAEADRDIPKLLALKERLAIRRVFLSVEPMLGPVDLERIPMDRISPEECGAEECCGGRIYGNALDNRHAFCDGGGDGEAWIAPSIDWVICGGESQKGARPMHVDWARSLRDQCARAETPFTFKQWGEWAPWFEVDGGENYMDGRWTVSRMDGVPHLRVGKHEAGRLLDGRPYDGRPLP